MLQGILSLKLLLDISKEFGYGESKELMSLTTSMPSTKLGALIMCSHLKI